MDSILSRLEVGNCTVKAISLVCGAETLTERLSRDVEAGLRDADSIRRSLDRLPLYDRMDTVKLDVSGITAEETAEKLAAL